MCRLAIIDVQGGQQPIHNEDRTITVVCNGELYNYVEGFRDLTARGHRLQSESDVNLVPHYYEDAGCHCFKHFRGMFAMAIWDAPQRRLVLGRDRVGKKPLFYAPVRAGLAFASELPALLALLDRVPSHLLGALGDYLRLGCVPHPETIYEGVFALPPGSSLTFTPGGPPVVEPYWGPTSPPQFSGTKRDALVEIDQRLREAVALRLRSDVPVGMFLSGGIDSGLVASYSVELGARDLLCFVVEVDDPRLDEAPAARRTAARLGLPVETIRLSLAPRDAIERISLLYGQPFGDASAVPSYFVARAAVRHRKVVLNGDGGDEVFAGYRRYWAARAVRALDRWPALMRDQIAHLARGLARIVPRRSGMGFVARTLRGAALRDGDRYLAWTQDLLSEADVHRCFPALAAEGSTLDRLERLCGERPTCATVRNFLRSDYRLLLADDLLPKMDIATMANSLEARSPLLDVPLAEFSWSLPEAWLVSNTETKPLLRTLARDRLPPDVTAAPKRGFEVPLRRWLEADLHDAVGDLLLSADSRVGGLGAQSAVRTLVERRTEFAGNHERMVWSLLMLELFLRAPTPAPAVG